jgi:hypothetical protein
LPAAAIWKRAVERVEIAGGWSVIRSAPEPWVATGELGVVAGSCRLPAGAWRSLPRP